MKNPFKVKTRSQMIKTKKPMFYLIRRVYNRWEMSSGLHVILGDDLNEMAAIMRDLENPPDVVAPPPKKSKAKAKGSPRPRKKKTRPKKGRA